MTPETLALRQAELRARNSTHGGRKATRRAVKTAEEARARLMVKEELKKGRLLNRAKRRWRKQYRKLRADKRKWMSTLREDAKALHIANLALHKEMTAAQAELRYARAQHTTVTVDEQRAQDVAKGYRLGLEAAQKKEGQSENRI
jgi:hypothetical protein